MKQEATLNKRKFTIEIIAFDLESCIPIQAGGADRIELCADPGSGGTTPAYGLLKTARATVDLPIFPMIRPRGGDFLYTGDEFKVMLRDIELCKQLEYPGIVLGILDQKGGVDTRRLSQLVEAAQPMQVTFHRAFDHCRDPFQALEQVIEAGCSRILTSGQATNALEGMHRIRELVQLAGQRICIMPGSGIHPGNITELALGTQAREYHASLRQHKNTQMQYVNPAFPKTEMDYLTVDEAEVKALKDTVNLLR